MKYIDQLIKNCESAKKAEPIKIFEVHFEAHNAIKNDLSIFEGIENAIYIIEEIDGNPDVTFTKMTTYKQLKKRACPKLNSPCSIYVCWLHNYRIKEAH